MVLFDLHASVCRVSDIQNRITIVQGTCWSLMSCSQPWRYDVDRVVHLACILGGPASEKAAPYLRVSAWVRPTSSMACRLHGVSRVVYANSVAVYGGLPNRDQEVTEDVVPRPNSFYGACKLWAEHIAETYTYEYGLDVIGLRPTSVFGLGRGQRGTPAS